MMRRVLASALLTLGLVVSLVRAQECEGEGVGPASHNYKKCAACKADVTTPPEPDPQGDQPSRGEGESDSESGPTTGSDLWPPGHPYAAQAAEDERLGKGASTPSDAALATPGGGGTLHPECGGVVWEEWVLPGTSIVGTSRWQIGKFGNWLGKAWECEDHLPKEYCVSHPFQDAGAGGKAHDEAALEFSLFYDSQRSAARMTGNWWFPYDVYVVPQGNGDLRYYGPRANGALYQWDVVSQTFASPPGFFDRMVLNGNGTWTRTTTSGMAWNFNTAGYLASVVNRYGLTTQFQRNAQNGLTSIVDYAGRSIQIAYNAQGLATSVTDWAGRVTSLTYTAQGYLASITRPSTTFYDRATAQIVTRGKTTTFTYVTGTGTPNDGNLLTVVDDRGQQVFAAAYDGADRATSLVHRGRTWTVSYNPASTLVADPDGITISYGFNANGAITRREVFTRTGLGQTPLRQGEPNSYVWLYERNAACGCDLITKTTYPDGATETNTYDLLGNLLSEILAPAPGGLGSTIHRTWTYSSFNQFCRVLTHTTPEGYAPGATAADFTYTMTYDASGNLTQIQYPKAKVSGTLQHPVISYTYNSAGQVLTKTWPSGLVDTFEYSATTRLLTKYARDASGLNIRWLYAYDSLDRLVSVTDPRGFATTYQYNALDQTTEAAGAQPLAPRVTFLFDNNDNHYRVEMENKDASGTVSSSNPWFSTFYTYDQYDRLTSATQEIDAATTRAFSYSYSAGGRLSRFTDPNGNKTDFEYDERGFYFRITTGAGTAQAASVVHNPDLNGNLASIVDPRGNTSTMTHDHAGRITRLVFANGVAEELTYDRAGNVTLAETRDPQGIVVRRSTAEYDPLGLLTSSASHLLNAGGTTTQTFTTSITRDADLRTTAVADPLSATTLLTYDGVGRTIQVKDAATNKIDIVYNAGGLPTNVTRSDWNQLTASYDAIVWEFVHDDLGRVAQTTRRDPANTLSSVTTQTHDGRGLVLDTTDEMGNTAHFAWDGLGRLLSQTQDLRSGGTGSGQVIDTIQILRTYDPGSRLLSIKDGLNKATSYQYDALDRVSAETDPANGSTAYTYDANGNVLTLTDPLGNVVTSTYDNMDRLTARSISRASGVLGTTAETYGYDALGQTTSMVDNDSTIQRTYDSLGRVLTETTGPNPLGGAGKTFTFSYNGVGAVTGITYPDGTVLQYSRDSIQRLSSLAIQGGSTLGTYSYTGRTVIQTALLNGVTESPSFDALRRKTLVHYHAGSTTLKKFEYVWSPADQRLLEKRHHANGTGDNYGLDSLYRTVLVKAGVADPVAEHQNPGSQTVASTTTAAYNKVNSRSQVVVNAGGPPTTTTYTSDALEFYTSVGGIAQARDGNGNLKDDGTRLYDYDYRNQLVKATRKSDGVVLGAYDYDAIGRRTAKTTAAGTTSFVWIGLQMAAEYDAQGLFSRRHLGATFGAVVAAAQRDVADLDTDGNTTEHLLLTPLYDGAFDCVGVLGPTGAVVESYVYTYEGSVTISNGAGQVISTSAMGWQQGYSGLYRDEETGLDYAVHRYYQPGQGRFMTLDPLSADFAGGALGNPYVWAENRFGTLADPLGLWPVTRAQFQALAYQRVSNVTKVVDDALHAAPLNAMTSEMSAMVTAIDNGEVTFRIASDEEMPGDATMATTRTGTGHPKSPYRFLVSVRFSALWDVETNRTWSLVFNWLHEMLHVAKWKCGIKSPHHAGDVSDPTTQGFNNEVSWIIQRLRRGETFAKLYSESDLWRARQMKALHGQTPAEPGSK